MKYYGSYIVGMQSHWIAMAAKLGVAVATLMPHARRSAASNVKIYVNGTSDSSITTMVNTLNDTMLNNISVVIGNRASGYNFNGLINHMRIWNKELSSAEASSLYNSGNLLAY